MGRLEVDKKGSFHSRQASPKRTLNERSAARSRGRELEPEHCLFCLLLVPGAKECPQAPQDDAGRETPERKGLGKSQVVGCESQALCASSG
eukprot:scaffold5118_cov118-Isochrysis_galbana.AAC.3